MTCEVRGNAIVCSRGGSSARCPICGTSLRGSGGGKTYGGMALCSDCSAQARDPQFKAWVERQLYGKASA